MKRIALTVSALALTGSAHAADLAYKAPVYKAPPPVAAPYNWTGLYASMGFGWERSNLSWALTNPAPAGLPPFSAAGNDTIFSGKIGYQYQFGWMVVGVDAGASTLTSQPFLNGPVGGAPGGCTVNVGQLCQVRISDSIKTVGGKLGIAWNDWLFYGEGGGAWSQVQSQFFTPPGNLFDPVSQHRSGWYAGGGIDHVLFRFSPVDVIAGVEYRHVDLGSQFVQSVVDGGPNGPNSRVVGAKEDAVLGRLTLKWNVWP